MHTNLAQVTTPSGAIVDSETGQLVQAPPASSSVSPATPLQTPATPTTPNQTTAGNISSVTTGTFNPPNLQPGMQSPDVATLQKFLTQSGFNIPAGPTGFYGPQTQQALSQFQTKYGVNTGTYPGYFGPQTKSVIAQNQELAQKFQQLFEQQKGTEAPQNNAEARATVDNLTKEPSGEDATKKASDVYFAMNPGAKQLFDTLNQVLSTNNTKTSFVDTYNQLRQQMGVPELNTQFLNMRKVIRGTEQDIRDEITKAGGSATESQVQAMTAARTRVLQNQAANISDQLQIANDYVDKTVSLTQADRQQVWNQLDRQIGLTEKMVTIQNDLNNASRGNYEKIVNNVGYDGLANAIGNNPQQQRYVENLLGLRGGALSDPVWLEQAKTFRQQQLGLAQGGMMRAIADPLTGAITYYYSKPPVGGQAGPVSGGIGSGINPGTTVPTPTKPPAWLQSTIETAAGIQYIDATKLKGQAQQYQAQKWAAENNVAFLASDDVKEVQKANQTYQSAATLINKIKDYSTKVLLASNNPLAMGEQAAKLYTIEHAPILSTNNNAKEYIAARNSLVSLITRAAGEKGTLTDMDVGRIISALPGYSDNKDLAQNKARNLDDVVRSVFQGSINAYVINSGYKTNIPTEETIKVRLKKTGQTGSIPVSEFDSNIYEKL